LDISPSMLEILKKHHGRVETVCGDVEKMPFEDESFDVVTAMFLIVHLYDLEKTFDEIYRVLKPGGIFILSNINQRKAPKLKTSDGEEIVIRSHYHMPEKVLSALEHSFFEVEKEVMVMEGKTWVNQIIKAVK